VSAPNASKEWESHLEIVKLLEKISRIESGITSKSTAIKLVTTFLKSKSKKIKCA
jgi:hypothetical protein